MTYKPSIRQLAFVLPLGFSKAEIIFTRHRQNYENRSFKVIPGQNPRHAVSTEALEKGTWLAQLIWSVGRAQYCQEKLIEIG